MFRTIYMVEIFHLDGCLLLRTYARNKKTAERIARKHFRQDRCVLVDKLRPESMANIRPEWVEG